MEATPFDCVGTTSIPFAVTATLRSVLLVVRPRSMAATGLLRLRISHAKTVSSPQRPTVMNRWSSGAVAKADEVARPSAAFIAAVAASSIGAPPLTKLGVSTVRARPSNGRI